MMLAPMVEAASDSTTPQIPDKLYFRIGEVSRLTGLKQHVLRYWETEFAGLGPKKSGTGHRLYRRKDVELLLQIKYLLYEKRYTIEGARKWLEDRDKPPAAAEPARKKKRSGQAELFPSPADDGIDAIRKELQDILKLLG